MAYSEKLPTFYGLEKVRFAAAYAGEFSKLTVSQILDFIHKSHEFDGDTVRCCHIVEMVLF